MDKAQLGNLARKSLTSVMEYGRDGFIALLELTAEVKGVRSLTFNSREGIELLLYDDKADVGVKNTAQNAVKHLGGKATLLRPDADLAAVKNVGTQAFFIGPEEYKTFSEGFRKVDGNWSIPVIGGLGIIQPWQAVADYLTIKEYLTRSNELRPNATGKRWLKIAYVGEDAAGYHPLLEGGVFLGADVVMITPKGKGLDDRNLWRIREATDRYGSSFRLTNDLGSIGGADVIYVDKRIPIGSQGVNEGEKQPSYRITKEVMEGIAKGAILMGPSAFRQDILNEVFGEGQKAHANFQLIRDQAINRAHALQAVLYAATARPG
ncbi:MAG TPA: hypothetical protein VJB12_03800 [Candidatus Nanoarchaeia archaeon]|nr:hypothetical protein [Candidatus Nanoarchaeia archaeon]